MRKRVDGSASESVRRELVEGRRAVVVALCLALLLAAPAAAQTQVQVAGEAPNAFVQISYTGPIGLRAKPVAVLDTMGDLGRLRVQMTLNGQGVYEGNAVLNRNGDYKFHFEGEDLVAGNRLRDDNSGAFYGFEVVSAATRESRERALRASAGRAILTALPSLRGSQLFFNNRQPADGRVAIVRSADGRNVMRVKVANGGSRKVTVIERVK